MAIGDYDIGDYDVVNRASRVLRAAPEPGWSAVQDRVIAAVRATPRGGWPITVVDPDPGSAPGRLQVSDLALRAAIARALGDDTDLALSGIDVTLDEDVLRTVSIEVSGRFGADLGAVAARVRALAAAVVEDVVGRFDDHDVAIDVTVGDVHR